MNCGSWDRTHVLSLADHSNHFTRLMTIAYHFNVLVSDSSEEPWLERLLEEQENPGSIPTVSKSVVSYGSCGKK